MPTIAVSQTIRQATMRRVGRHDRLFYGGVAVSMALMAIVGFAPTFYLRLFSGGPMATAVLVGPFTPLIYIHGALFTAWVALFIVQTTLISTRRVAVHRRVRCRGCGSGGCDGCGRDDDRVSGGEKRRDAAGNSCRSRSSRFRCSTW